MNTDMGLHRSVVAVDTGLTLLALAKENWREPVVISAYDPREVWKGKELHSRFYRALNGPDINFKASTSWLRYGDLELKVWFVRLWRKHYQDGQQSKIYPESWYMVISVGHITVLENTSGIYFWLFSSR